MRLQIKFCLLNKRIYVTWLINDFTTPYIPLHSRSLSTLTARIKIRPFCHLNTISFPNNFLCLLSMLRRIAVKYNNSIFQLCLAFSTHEEGYYLHIQHLLFRMVKKGKKVFMILLFVRICLVGYEISGKE